MARNKPAAKKIRLLKKANQNRRAPIWAAIRKFGSGVLHKIWRWNRMNVKAQRHWRVKKLKE